METPVDIAKREKEEELFSDTEELLKLEAQIKGLQESSAREFERDGEEVRLWAYI